MTFTHRVSPLKCHLLSPFASLAAAATEKQANQQIGRVYVFVVNVRRTANIIIAVNCVIISWCWSCHNMRRNNIFL